MSNLLLIKDKLKHLGFPELGYHRIELIRVVLSSEFDTRLDKALAGDNDSCEYIKLVLKASSDFTIDQLVRHQLPSSMCEVLPIAVHEGQMFIRAVKALGSESNSPAAAAYLTEKLAARSNKARQRSPTFENDGDASISEVVDTEFYSQHAYGTKFALCFGAGLAADKKSRVLNIDGAPAVSARKYDWGKKIPIQLDMEEMYRLLAVLQVKTEFARFSNHGPNRDKHFTIKVQPEDGVFFATLSQQGKSNMSVQIPMTTAMSISIIILRQITEAFPHLTQPAISELLDSIVRMDKLASKRAD